MRNNPPASGLAACTLFAVALALTACDDDPLVPPGDGIPDVQSVAVVDTAGPIFRSLAVELDGVGDVEVFYEPIDGGRTLRVRSFGRTSHDVLMPRLMADTTYGYAVRASLGGIASMDVRRGTFTTASLPADLAGIDFSVEGEATFPLVMLNHSVPGGFSGVIGIDTDGFIAWYTDAFGTGGAATPIPGSPDMLFIARAIDAIVRVSPRGDVVAQLDFADVPGGGVHHDLAALDGNRVAFIAHDRRPVRDTLVSGEAVWVWDTETDAVNRVWSSWDHFDYDSDRGSRTTADDWLHANALSVGPRGNLIMSLHWLNQVISISADYQSIEWRLGGVNHTIGVSAADRFNGQHSAFELPGERVILFDNNYEGASAGGHSRGLELQMSGDTAWVVWEYVADPPIMSQIWSGIYALPNGHRVVSFPIPAVVQPAGGAPPMTVDEVDETGVRVWRLTGPDLTASFRGVPWTALAGEVEVPAMP